MAGTVRDVVLARRGDKGVAQVGDREVITRVVSEARHGRDGAVDVL